MESSKLKLVVLAFLLAIGESLFAQNPTTVTGTITDPNGVPYFPATVTACLTPVTTDPVVNGIHVNQTQGGNYCAPPKDTSATGAFSLGLFPNSAITPSGTQWRFTVTAVGTAPPAGKGSQTFQSTITISGTSQDIGATLTAASLALLNAGGATGAASTVFDAKNYGVKADTKFVLDASWASGVSPVTITITGTDPPFTAADTGKACWGIGANAATAPFGTFTFLTATTGTCSGTSTGAATANGTFVWGTDDTASLISAWNALIANFRCGVLVLPAGYMITTKGQFNAYPAGCGAGGPAPGEFGAAGVRGQGQRNTQLLPSPNFDFTTCITGGGCFASPTSGVGGFDLADFTINGLTNQMGGLACGSGTQAAVVMNNISHMHSVGITSWCNSSTATFPGLQVLGQGDVVDGFSFVDTAGHGTQCQANGANVLFDSMYCGGGTDAGTDNMSVGASATLVSVNSGYGPVGVNHDNIKVFGNYVATGDYTFGTGATVSIGLDITSGAKATLTQFTANNGGAAGSIGIEFRAGAGGVNCLGCSITGGSTGGSLAGAAGAGTFIDQGINTFVGPTSTFSGLYIPVGGGTVATNKATASTNFGVALGAQTIISSVIFGSTLDIKIGFRQVTLGVACSAVNNTVSGTLSWTSGGAIQTATLNTLTISGNGSSGSSSIYQSIPIHVDNATPVTFTTASTLGSVGCTTVPQYVGDFSTI